MHEIIVPLDGSPHSERAICLSLSLAAALDAGLRLVHVMPSPTHAGLAPVRLLPDFITSKDYLAGISRRLPARRHVQTEVLTGDPAEEILQLTHVQRGSIVVMATHGRNALGRLAFGSVGDQIMREATVPVALTSTSATEPEHHFRTIIVPLDGSDLAESALPLATDLARRTGATLSLVRVVDRLYEPSILWPGGEFDGWHVTPDQMDEINGQMLDDARRYLERVAVSVRTTHPNTVWEVRTGQPASEITRAAETNHGSIIAIVSHGRGGLRRLALGSVTTEVVHKSRAPVLVIPPGAAHAPAS